MQTTTEIVERLRAEIDRSGRSLYDITKSAGLGYAAVHRISNGQQDGMTIATFVRLATTLGLSIELRRVRRSRSKE
jgi:hypothetical protein